MNVYLLDKAFADNALRLLPFDQDAAVVLIKDGVYLDAGQIKTQKVYAIEEDVKLRGVAHRLEGKAEIIGYPELVDLLVGNKVMNFV
jgi:sulfur relay protein TusB/DsrH